ncbi:MAG TPA: hypothetical protein VN783_01760 [Thermoanaerobaculia bacterium]|nr:hypothetical protein [Thermoanaerobaculia bacterium]
MAINARSLNVRQIESELNERFAAALPDLTANSLTEIKGTAQRVVADLGLNANVKVQMEYRRSEPGDNTIIIIIIIILIL